MYDRLRVLVYDQNRPFTRGDEDARVRYEGLLGGMGCVYAGWESHPRGRAHLFLLNEPTTEQIARMLLFAQSSEKNHGLSLELTREAKDSDAKPYNLDAIMANVAEVFGEIMLREQNTHKIALGWSDLKVMRQMINCAFQIR